MIHVPRVFYLYQGRCAKNLRHYIYRMFSDTYFIGMTSPIGGMLVLFYTLILSWCAENANLKSQKRLHLHSCPFQCRLEYFLGIRFFFWRGFARWLLDWPSLTLSWFNVLPIQITRCLERIINLVINRLAYPTFLNPG